MDGAHRSWGMQQSIDFLAEHKKHFEEYPMASAKEERRIEGRGSTVIRLMGVPASSPAWRFMGIYVHQEDGTYRQTLWSTWGPWKLRKQEGYWRVGSRREDGYELSIASTAASPLEIHGEWRPPPQQKPPIPQFFHLYSCRVESEPSDASWEVLDPRKERPGKWKYLTQLCPNERENTRNLTATL